jgi:hypothetical protein
VPQHAAGSEKQLMILQGFICRRHSQYIIKPQRISAANSRRHLRLLMPMPGM